MKINCDFSDLLRVLSEGGVRFLVVGGYAVMRYTEPRRSDYFETRQRQTIRPGGSETAVAYSVETGVAASGQNW